MIRDRIHVGAGSPIEVPATFEHLYDLAHNVWWSWDYPARRLWRTISRQRWVENRNPLSMLAAIDARRWAALANNVEFTELYLDVTERFQSYLGSSDTWYHQHHDGALDGGVAYLSAEFGVHATLPFYSGGLGVLAGDHAKAASDLGLPLVGVGLFYRRGYFRQEVDHDGEQQHHYYHIEIARRPVRPVVDTDGDVITVSVDLPGRTVALRAWRVDVGRVPLVLLDSDLEENHPADRSITHTLYVRDREARLTQEIMLGIGAVRILSALGIDPAVWHINEGHAAFSLLDRLGTTGDISKVAENSTFTLHTPVPAGNEVFDPAMVEPYVEAALPLTDWATAQDLARGLSGDSFNLSALAIRLTSRTNGVSKRHAEVVSHDWGDVIGGPANAVTNAIHLPTWTGPAMAALWTKTFGAGWSGKILEDGAEETIRSVSLEDLWAARQSQKRRMVAELRLHLLEQGARQGAAPPALRELLDAMQPERLTIVFARRFATYKRAELLFHDPDRLASIVADPDRPVQIIFAGKAHPADRAGQDLIKSVMQIATRGPLRDNVFFIENYDMELARFLVTGADVWLNNPEPPKEASGTSGMKAAVNGGLNLSVLDGWWLEGYNGANGWGWGAEGGSEDEDAITLYNLLADSVIPLFYEADADGVPRGWVEMMRESVATLSGHFNAQRMLIDYVDQAYLPAASTSPS